MKVKRFYTTQEGGSTFDEVEIPLVQKHLDKWGNSLGLSTRFDSAGVCLFEISDDAFQDWHNAPQRQLCVVLEGEWQVETTDGVAHTWGRGDMFLPDDVDGKGHISRVIRGPVRILFVPLDPSFDLSRWQPTEEIEEEPDHGN